jgi:hypothetical protein
MKLALLDQGQGEGEARVVETDGARAVLESSQPFPAGATLIGRSASGAEYRVKVRGGRRIDARWFRIEGRFVSLTKTQREEILAQVQGAGA